MRKESGSAGFGYLVNWTAVWSGSPSLQRRLQLFLFFFPPLSFFLSLKSTVGALQVRIRSRVPPFRSAVLPARVSPGLPFSAVCSTQPAGRAEWWRERSGSSSAAAASQQRRGEERGLTLTARGVASTLNAAMRCAVALPENTAFSPATMTFVYSRHCIYAFSSIFATDTI